MTNITTMGIDRFSEHFKRIINAPDAQAGNVRLVGSANKFGLDVGRRHRFNLPIHYSTVFSGIVTPFTPFFGNRAIEMRDYLAGDHWKVPCDSGSTAGFANDEADCFDLNRVVERPFMPIVIATLYDTKKPICEMFKTHVETAYDLHVMALDAAVHCVPHPTLDLMVSAFYKTSTRNR